MGKHHYSWLYGGPSKDGGWVVPFQHSEPPSPSAVILDEHDDGPTILRRLQFWYTSIRTSYWLLGISFRQLDNGFDRVTSTILRSTLLSLPPPKENDFFLPDHIAHSLLALSAPPPFNSNCPLVIKVIFRQAMKESFPHSKSNEDTIGIESLVYLLWAGKWLTPGARKEWSSLLVEEWANEEDESARKWVKKAERKAEELMKLYGSRIGPTVPVARQKKRFYMPSAQNGGVLFPLESDSQLANPPNTVQVLRPPFISSRKPKDEHESDDTDDEPERDSRLFEKGF